MNKFFLVMGIFALTLSLSACKSKSSSDKSSVPPAHSSQNALDWDGTYSGIMPCADCAGIETTLTLNRNSTYKLSTRYMGEEDIQAVVKEGAFKWTEDGSTIVLESLNNNEYPTKYKVGENKLIQLDLDGNVITGELADDYVLLKANKELVEKYWKLYEIMGEPIKEGDLPKDAYLTFKVEGNRVFGNGGCNGISGTYKLSEGNGIRFSQMVATMMMCQNTDVEQKLLKALNMVDNYYAQNDTLVLNRARMAPLARFVAVYM